MTEPLPVLLRSNLPAPLGDRHLVPTVIADLGEQASWRYVEFFTTNIRNANTRRAYARASCRFLAWAEERSLALTQIRASDSGTAMRSEPSHGPRRNATSRRRR